ncbi:hypothetical protein [Glaesserella sp.]|uniref:hypothetical protein n=1 Tax=Glaesserella sp. TaxID=2094731 RepID=UPI0035A1C221
MRKSVILFSLFCFFSSNSFAISGSELSENNKPVQPTNSTYLQNKEVLVKRYVLAQSSSDSSLNMAKRVAREIGSDGDKTVHIIWTNKSSEQVAKRIRDALVKLNVKKKNIHLERSKMKRDSYPLYVEVKHIGVRAFNCKVDTGEDMMSFDPYNPCATKSNSQIQLKN